MFDPTAFENLKVVIEGALYDQDFCGDIVIIDRNDFINTAKLSRKYEITFTKRLEDADTIICTLVLEAGLENFAAELLESLEDDRLSGCNLLIKFSLKHRNDLLIFKRIEEVLTFIWGQDRTIHQSVITNPFIKEKFIKNEIMVGFNRLIYEDQIDDLIFMIEYMVNSIDEMRKIIK